MLLTVEEARTVDVGGLVVGLIPICGVVRLRVVVCLSVWPPLFLGTALHIVMAKSPRMMDICMVGLW